jgi:predicted TIM-barrel enzyme
MIKTRADALKKIREEIKAGKPIIGAGAGTGISAKFEEEGGVDLIVLYNSGRYRMSGRGSLAGLMPYGDANNIVTEMAGEVLTIVKNTPVLAGVCGTDPFKIMSKFLLKLKEIGFIGVQNFPTVGLIDGVFRQNLEETGMGYDLEVEMIRIAHELDMLTSPYVFNIEDTKKMVRAGADLIVAHMGLTTKGSIGATTALTIDESVSKIQEIANTAKELNPEVIVLCHGGPISEPGDAEYVLSNTKQVEGFYGASSMERLPVEIAIREQIKKFKNIKI